MVCHILKISILILIFSQTLFAQDLPELSFKNNSSIEKSDSLKSFDEKRYAAFYLSTGILAFEDHKGFNTKLLLTGDASVQFSEWFYLDLKVETYKYTDTRNAVIISLMPAFGLNVFNNKRFLLMSGLGFSIIGAKGGHGLGSMYSAFSRLRYEMTKVFGVFSEVRYGLAPDGSNNHKFFINLGISLQAPLNTSSY